MKNRIKNTIRSPRFVLIMGLVVVPLLSFMLITTGPESPLYTSISRLAWCHKHWFATFLWAVVVMSVILLLTFRMTVTGPLSPRVQRRFLTFQTLNISLVFVGCLLFPAKDGVETVRFVHYVPLTVRPRERTKSTPHFIKIYDFLISSQVGHENGEI